MGLARGTGQLEVGSRFAYRGGRGPRQSRGYRRQHNRQQRMHSELTHPHQYSVTSR